MPRYTFEGPDDVEPNIVELLDDNTAWAEAVTYCSDVLRDKDGALRDGVVWHLTVKDQAGRMLGSIHLEVRRPDA